MCMDNIVSVTAVINEFLFPTLSLDLHYDFFIARLVCLAAFAIHLVLFLIKYIGYIMR